MKILIVDDDKLQRDPLVAIVSGWGHETAAAIHGAHALEVLERFRADVIVTDLKMPRMDGFDLLRNVRADARLADLPVIMITSRIAQKHRDYAFQLGANHYLGKPYSEDELLTRVAGYAPVATGVH